MEESGKTNLEPATKKWTKHQKILLIFAGIIVGGFIVVYMVYSYLYAKGEENLKKPPVLESSEEMSAILYNGKEYNYKKDTINILCLGIDKHLPMEETVMEGYTVYGLSDANFVVSINTKEETIDIIAIPREAIVDVKLTDAEGNVVRTEKDQLCYQYTQGRTLEQSGELTTEAVSKLLHLIPIQRYCAITMDALPIINDAIGGVDVTVLESMPWCENFDGFIEGEKLHLEGQVAFEYVHERNENEFASSLKRVQRQKQYIKEFLKQGKEAVEKDPSIPLKVFSELKDNMNTNLTVEDITYLVTEFLEIFPNLDMEDIIQVVPGEQTKGEEFEEYIVDDEALKEMIINIFYEEA